MAGDGVVSRVRRIAMATTVVAVLCLGLPLAVAARVLVVDDERGEVERIAVTAAARLSIDAPTAGDLPELPLAETTTAIGYYNADGTLSTGRGPRRADHATTQATTTGAVITTGGAWSIATSAGPGVVAASPVTNGATVIGAVRVATGPAPLWWRTIAAWAALTAAGLAALALARILASRAATRMAAPIHRLRTAAAAIGDGDLTTRAQPSGIQEVDDVADALNTTAGRLAELLYQERALGAAAAHQLRTPVMRLQLLLDAGRNDPPGEPGTLPPQDSRAILNQAADEAAELADQLEYLLRLTREGPEGRRTRSPIDLLKVLDDLERRHAPLASQHRRRLEIGADPALPQVVGSATSLGHALDILVDNALRHGAGTVRVRARETLGTVALDVEDEGHGFNRTARGLGQQPDARTDMPAGERLGLGLGLARVLVEAEHGRLVLPGPTPHARVTIMLSPEREA